jgi:hypothetical protein
MWAMILFVVHAHKPEGVILLYGQPFAPLELILVMQKEIMSWLKQRQPIYINMKKNLNNKILAISPNSTGTARYMGHDFVDSILYSGSYL